MSEYVFESAFSPWEMALSKMKRGSVLPATRFLSLLEQDQSVEAESAAMDLEEMEILLDVSGLPKLAASGKTDARLILEEKNIEATIITRIVTVKITSIIKNIGSIFKNNLSLGIITEEIIPKLLLLI